MLRVVRISKNMAGNKINAKAKGKDEKGKIGSKNTEQNNEEAEDPDFSLLRKPICTTVTGFGQARKIFDLATEEVKTLLSDECDLLYECKVCRNMFRSLANFISHKRVYCKEKFNSTIHGHFIKSTTTLNELAKINQDEKSYQESLKDVSESNQDDDEDERIPLSKDLTEIVEKIAKKTKLCNDNSVEQTVITNNIPQSSVAVFQTIKPKDGFLDNMRVQVKELQKFLSKDTAVLQNDGKFKIESVKHQESDNVIQISDDDDNNGGDSDLKCRICYMQFSTQKTLRFHMKYKHMESRLVYPCPDCLEIFSTSWSVYRHLFKVHRKTAAQIRRLRESIQMKAFRMNNPPAFYEKRKNNVKPVTTQKITEEERLDQENQAWMDNMEGDGEGPRCGGCGRSFERRAALAAHTHTCVSRTRALAAARLPKRQDNKRIQIQIRRDYHKEPATTLQTLATVSSAPERTADVDSNEIKLGEIDDQTPVVASDLFQNNEKMLDENEKNTVKTADTIKTAKSESSDTHNGDDLAESPEKMDYSMIEDVPKPVIRLPFARQAEKGNLAALKLKIQSDLDFNKLLCKKCDMQCNTIQELYDHTAVHYKWMRYACKLCNFKNYYFDKLPEHVKMVHKLKGDKDFYSSTIKAIDGPEALELCESVEDMNDADDISPDSQRTSRCSSDSSRLSDDSSSSSALVEIGSRKRKAFNTKLYAKKRKESLAKENADKRDDPLASDKEVDNDLPSVIKTEENSSDIDEVEEKIVKRFSIDTSSVASRRPVRRKAKPKNEDFEYDLSNLLKLEAQGYRDSQTTLPPKLYQTKKKIQQEIQLNFDNLNKDCCGALVTLSKKAVENAAAHMKVTNFPAYLSQKDRFSNVFVRPMVPKNIIKIEKSPKKDVEDKGNSSSHIIEEKTENKNFTLAISKIQKDNDELLSSNLNKENTIEKKKDILTITKEQYKVNVAGVNKEQKNSDKILIPNAKNDKVNGESTQTVNKDEIRNTKDSLCINPNEKNISLCEALKSNRNIPSMVPIKFRRQSLEGIKNHLINQNLKDLTKAGMKTKILVIKPITRNQDGSKGSLSSPLKFQTITLKDPNKNTSSEEKSDQVVVVKVPKVDCVIPRTIESTGVGKEIVTPSNKANNEKELESAKIVPLLTNETPKLDEDSKKINKNNCNSECEPISNDSNSSAVEETAMANENKNINNYDNTDTAVQ